MNFPGQVIGGVVVFEGPSRPAEGAKVRVEELPESRQETPAWGEVFKGLAGSIEGPDDLAENHDHYIHATPKK